MMPTLTLVSHALCPYVQRAAIAMAERSIPFERIYVDLSDKPDWFTAISPLGKVPLLQVNEGERTEVIFESAVILEYLEETWPRALHPSDPLERALHRGWIAYGSGILDNIARLYNAKTEDVFVREADGLRARFERLEADLAARKVEPFFAGANVSLVDAVFGPVFRYFDVVDDHVSVLDDLPRVAAWRAALASRESVRSAVGADYPALLTEFLIERRTHISTLMSDGVAESSAETRI